MGIRSKFDKAKLVLYNFKMPFKKLEDKEKYNYKYYRKNRKQILNQQKFKRAEKHRDWKNWYLKKKNLERKAKIQSRQIYKPKVF